MKGANIWLRVAILNMVVTLVIVLVFAERARESDHRNRTNAYHASIAACHRGNVLRGNLNDTTETQLTFLRAALTARERAVQTAKTDADRKLNEDAAATYRTLIKHSHTAPIIDCATAFAKP